MVQLARARIDDLFGLAVLEGVKRPSPLADRYVRLARAVGTRYNVRIPPEYRELYCRRCSSYWTEGRTVRTRLRNGRRVRTCLLCGAVRRTPNERPLPSGSAIDSSTSPGRIPQQVLAGEPSEAEEEAAEFGSEDEE
jgi:ribonuclease P protein subunit RPR2